MTIIWVEWLGLSLVALVVVAYWLYTLFGVSFLEPLIQSRVRRIIVFMGVMAASASLALEALQSVVALPIESLLPTLGAVISAAYAIRKQWLIPNHAPRFEPCSVKLDPMTLLAVLGDGSAVPLSWLRTHRTVRVGSVMIVHCGIARSLTAYSAGEVPHDVAAVLPHGSGFLIGNGTRRWDGVNGKALWGGEDLKRLPLSLCRASAWQGDVASNVLYGPAGKPPRVSSKNPTPRVPGARGVENAAQWGRVLFEERWEPVTDEELMRYQPEQSSRDNPASFYLARWAAIARGYVIDDETGRAEREHPESDTP